MEQEVMQAIRAELESNIDAKYREFHSSLVPGQNCRILGVRIPVSRRIAKATARDHYEVYTEQFNPEVYEELLIRGMMIGYGKLTSEEQTAELDRFVPMINSWGICDSSRLSSRFLLSHTSISRSGNTPPWVRYPWSASRASRASSLEISRA